MVRHRGVDFIAGTNELTAACSIQEALRMYLQPIKNNDHELDFYTMYRRETMDYDTEYMRKCNEDLNTTLIFVRIRDPFPFNDVNQITRLVCSLQSVPPSLSLFSQGSSRTPANAQKYISERSSLASTNPFLLVKIPQLHQRGMDHPQRLLHPWIFCTRAFWCHCLPPSSQCWANSG